MRIADRDSKLHADRLLDRNESRRVAIEGEEWLENDDEAALALGHTQPEPAFGLASREH